MALFDQNPAQPSEMPGDPLPSPVSRQKHILRIVWYVFLGLVALGTLGGVAHGEISGFWFLALFGLPTLWLFKGLEMRIKAIATGIFAFIFLCSAIYSITPLGKAANASYHKEEAHDAQIAAQKKQQEDKDAAQQKALEAKEQSKQDAEKDKPIEKKAVPNISVSETPNTEQGIKNLMKDRFGNRLRNISVSSREDGGYGVFVGFNIGNDLTNGLAKISIEEDMKQAYKDLYTSNFDVHYANMIAYGATQDKFGNESNSNVYETHMMRDIGRQINWNNYTSLDFNDLWTVERINPSFQH